MKNLKTFEELNLDNSKYKVDDEIIIAGRKNKSGQTGIHCYIETVFDEYIKIEEQEILCFNFYQKKLKNYMIHYSIESLGTNPEYQYYTIKTTSLSHKRYQKLKNIEMKYEQ